MLDKPLLRATHPELAASPTARPRAPPHLALPAPARPHASDSTQRQHHPDPAPANAATRSRHAIDRLPAPANHLSAEPNAGFYCDASSASEAAQRPVRQ